MVRSDLDEAFAAQQQQALLGTVEQAAAAAQDLVEHGLRVGHRAADDLQHLGAGRLAFQRLLRLVEQPRVLDGDHRLVGKGAQQRDLRVGEGRRRRAHHGQPADRRGRRGAAARSTTSSRRRASTRSAPSATPAVGAVQHGVVAHDLARAARVAHEQAFRQRYREMAPQLGPCRAVVRGQHHRALRLVHQRQRLLRPGSSWVQSSMIASNTGRASAIELLIACSTCAPCGLARQRVLRFVEQTGVLQRHAQARRHGVQQAHLGFAEGVLALEVVQPRSSRRGARPA